MTTKKPSKSKSKKTSSTTAATSKKVKATVSAKRVETVARAPAVIETAPLAVPVEAPVVEQAPVRTLSRADFMGLVRKEAYTRAARRNFKNGSPFHDWVNAEAAVSGKLAAEGVRLS